MNQLVLSELDSNLKGIQLAFESIDTLSRLSNSISKSKYILVPSPVIKTVNITLESIHKQNKLDSLNVSLEDNENDTVFDKILSTIKAIWKKIVDTWNHIWEKISNFFTGNSTNAKILKEESESDNEKINKLSNQSNSFSKERVEIVNLSVLQPLQYLNKDISEKDITDLIVKALPSLREVLSTNINVIKKGYELTEKEIKNVKDLKIKSAEEIDTQLYNSFFPVIINSIINSSNGMSSLDSDDIDILLDTIPYENIEVDESKSKVLKGFIKGSCLYFCTLGDKNSSGLKIFECYPVTKKYDNNTKCSMYYVQFETLKELTKDLHKETEKYTEFSDFASKSYTEIKQKHNSIRKEMDSFINNKDIVSSEDPDNFRAKFETLKNISHSMLRFALESSKGVGMYTETITYYRKLMKINLAYHVTSVTNKGV